MNDSKTPYELLFDFVLHIKHHWSVIAEQHGMSLAQLHIVWLLMNGPAPMVQLSNLMVCDASYITGLVDRLEQLKLVERREDPSDRRVKLIALTRSGRQLRDDVYRSVMGLQAQLFAHLSDAERIEFTRLLRKIGAQAAAVPQAS
jgi:DNA-binding MarR family transcriptional regulator